MTAKTRTMDAIPANTMRDFLHAAKARGRFWYDMFYLCAALGLRNSECRELKRGHIDWTTQTLHLRDSKGGRAFITRRANQRFDAHWLSIGRRWLREHARDKHISLIVRLVSSSAGLMELAEEYGFESEFALFYQQYRAQHLPRFRQEAEKDAPAGRTLDLSLYPKARDLLKRRDEQAQARGWTCLFAREELRHARAVGDKPVSRQMVYHVCCQLREGLANKLKGIRIGLHSCRKFAVQRVVSLTRDVFTASVWVGHGNGRGNLAMTEHYLNRSMRRQTQVSKRLGAGIGQFE
ncbi:hypothetical protein CGH67_24275 [Vibrio parahaemolyticus]|uniref:hypothetical protein n=2 Tax=Vibrio parahaemolyticus TaxID=670 RepID=UPI00112018E7|nr:hypothetical protein [Vibrio parahaemolyticus]TOM64760.1 hypothetical protein CGH73_20945 [Vibrio parahaemolyticus]TOM99534.1 hypothetical protein CGH67_24275 [Vibrio parahaemolyticus]